ncbi:hypothetical protein Leryth_014893 [Lithospermum erythrorhizon]|nr:hypothetical protein Leryth_014893 [Lithospermum erythrorhizon]
MKSIERISKFREAQFLMSAYLTTPTQVVSVNPVYLKAGIESPKESKLLKMANHSYHLAYCGESTP